MSKRFVSSVLFVLVMGLVLSSAVEAADPDLVGYWPFDTSTADVSGNGNHGVVGGDPTWVPGIFNEALEFDGVDDYVALTNQPPITNGFTFSAWVRRNADSPATQDIFNNNQFFVRTRPEGEGDGSNPFEAFVKFTGPEPRALSNVASTPGQWFFVAVTWDRTTLQIYVDGELRGSSARSGELDAPVEARIGRGEQGNVNANPFNGVIDEVRIYSRVLTEEEIQQDMTTGSTNLVAKSPEPANEATDVAREVVLNWSPGEFANTHDVYFGASLEDVNNATATVDPAGVYQGRQGDATYSIGERLGFGQTYYWRIDEVNAAPDKTIFKGDVWSFTAEPISIPITSITATASGFNPGMEPSKTIDGSGLNELDQHSTMNTDMWLAVAAGSWIQYEFDTAYKLHEMLVWNSNQNIESFIGFGVKEAVIETSVDGNVWTQVEGVPAFARAPGQDAYEANTTVDLSGIVARYVKISPQSAYGFTGQNGLSEVRFLAIPNDPRELTPADGSVTSDIEVTLSWRAGREAATHEVYLGADPADLALAGTTDEPVFVAEGLDYDQTYAWQVVEVNEAETPATYAGAIQSFNTPTHGTVDDMESYSGEEGKEVFTAWLDGYGGDASLGGSTTGHIDGPFVETGSVYDGSQSMPVYIDNDGDFFDIDGKASSPTFSEVVRDLDGQDWTASGIKTLSIMFAGSPGLTGQLYCKIGNTKLLYDGDASNLGVSTWQAWNIDLSTVGGNLTGVRELAIGVEGGTSGILYIDAIRLYPRLGTTVTPVMPDTANLLAYYPLNGDYQDASGNGRHGVAVDDMGNFFIDGVSGQALDLSSGNGYVEIPGFKGITANDGVQQAFSISNWFTITETSGDHEMVTWGASPATERLTWRVHEGRLRTEHGGGNLRGNTYVNDGEWHHGALTVAEGANLRPDVTKLYVDGVEDSTFSGADNAYNLQPDADVCIGCRADNKTRFWPGSLDEVRIYDRVLSAEEVAGLAGKTKPVHKPL
jgi:hypothetical protein